MSATIGRSFPRLVRSTVLLGVGNGFVSKRRRVTVSAPLAGTSRRVQP